MSADKKTPAPVGRPAKPKEERHSQKVTIYLTEEERENVEAIAGALGIPTATLIRGMITRSGHYRNHLSTSHLPPTSH